MGTYLFCVCGVPLRTSGRYLSTYFQYPSSLLKCMAVCYSNVNHKTSHGPLFMTAQWENCSYFSTSNISLTNLGCSQSWQLCCRIHPMTNSVTNVLTVVPLSLLQGRRLGEPANRQPHGPEQPLHLSRSWEQLLIPIPKTGRLPDMWIGCLTLGELQIKPFHQRKLASRETTGLKTVFGSFCYWSQDPQVSKRGQTISSSNTLFGLDL